MLTQIKQIYTNTSVFRIDTLSLSCMVMTGKSEEFVEKTTFVTSFTAIQYLKQIKKMNQ